MESGFSHYSPSLRTTMIAMRAAARVVLCVLATLVVQKDLHDVVPNTHV